MKVQVREMGLHSCVIFSKAAAAMHRAQSHGTGLLHTEKSLLHRQLAGRSGANSADGFPGLYGSGGFTGRERARATVDWVTGRGSCLFSVQGF